MQVNIMSQEAFEAACYRLVTENANLFNMVADQIKAEYLTVIASSMPEQTALRESAYVGMVTVDTVIIKISNAATMHKQRLDAAAQDANNV